ncbi:MAG: hypothetical protein KBC50_00530 [Candidatus Pacebacteria bacterium]|nr:hypothetical protein [Candidatus Paceibacterota bacterium]
MTLTNKLVEMGFNPVDFREEIEALGDKEMEYGFDRPYLTIHQDDPRLQYSFKGVYDIKVEPDGRKLFMFSFNKKMGWGPMSYWWTVETLVNGKWRTVEGSGRYTGCTNYPSKFPKP